MSKTKLKIELLDDGNLLVQSETMEAKIVHMDRELDKEFPKTQTAENEKPSKPFGIDYWMQGHTIPPVIRYIQILTPYAIRCEFDKNVNESGMNEELRVQRKALDALYDSLTMKEKNEVDVVERVLRHALNTRGRVSDPKPESNESVRKYLMEEWKLSPQEDIQRDYASAAAFTHIEHVLRDGDSGSPTAYIGMPIGSRTRVCRFQTAYWNSYTSTRLREIADIMDGLDQLKE